MANVTGWAWRAEVNGCTEESGPRGSRGDMESDNQHRLQPSMREPGPMDSRMVTVQRRTLMEVKIL